ncbi:hypothetical protein A3H66_02750 [Candidatus Falkowbacteria bacterium RIFCSPLOWO2_02_FULL_45_21]|uniref:Peptidase S11 D-alanyl-D-alanine carboxypeptidase A N-terminal domain-containing protein n=1 Tax=Candidatus Falkowbacteria bacterium RIFCSPLOWO2_02_FULL_45_21 TaxID=1797989 RepID=A0A1F5SAN8_9BACT|nr:MAG: hypothetical protein A3H66_02750 [Candidatus Falkowbacteria bacterium RIFCSPLOWO2_02_FULL_45_21]
MLIPAAISLIISVLFLNLSPLGQGKFFIAHQSKPIDAGQVLGVSEKISAEKKSIEPNVNLNKTAAKMLVETKSLLSPRPGQPIRQPSSGAAGRPDRRREAIMVNEDFTAENGAILSASDNSLFFAKRPDQPWPIASITKLFTVYTFLDFNPGWEKSYEIKAADKREGGKIYLFTGDRVTVKDLFYFSLVGSDNTATAALVQATGLSEAEFVEKMNAKAKELGLKNTRLIDPIGLKDGNISTAREVAVFAKIILAKEDINRASLTKKYEFKTEQGRKKIIVSTNELLDDYPKDGISILGGKTGYLDSSGYCLVSQFKNYEGRTIVTVVLGADSDSSRFSLTRKLVDLYYQAQP